MVLYWRRFGKSVPRIDGVETTIQRAVRQLGTHLASSVVSADVTLEPYPFFCLDGGDVVNAFFLV